MSGTRCTCVQVQVALWFKFGVARRIMMPVFGQCRCAAGQAPLRGRGLHAQAAAASASGGCGWTMKLAASLPSAPAAPVFS
jgi:hypothetical protein